MTALAQFRRDTDYIEANLSLVGLHPVSLTPA